jgi:hypothetical protein
VGLIDADGITVWPEVAGTDGDGNPVIVPGDVGVTVRCSVQPVSATESAQLGQGFTTLYRVYAAALPVGAFGRVRWQGRDWDVVGEPQRRSGGPAGNDTMLIRARLPEST